MKKTGIMCSLLVLIALSQISLGETESQARERLVKEAERQRLNKSKQEEMKKEEKVTTTTSKPGEKKVEKKAVVKKNNKNMTESEKMAVEVNRIQKRVDEVNNDIETYKKTNEKLDVIEGKFGELQTRIEK